VFRDSKGRMQPEAEICSPVPALILLVQVALRLQRKWFAVNSAA